MSTESHSRPPGKPKLGDQASARLLLTCLHEGRPLDSAETAKLTSEWIDGCAFAGSEGNAGIEHWCGQAADPAKMRGIVARARDELAAIEERAVIPMSTAKGERKSKFNPIDIADLMDMDFPLTWLIKDAMVEGQSCILAGPKKALKTTLMLDAALSLASGKKFLGRFDVPTAVPSLIFTNESGGATIKETIRRIARAKDLDPKSLRGMLRYEENLPQFGTPADLDEMRERIIEYGSKVVFIDPAYKCLGGSSLGGKPVEHANLFVMGQMLGAVTSACKEAGATLVLLHHTRKSMTNDDGHAELADLQYAGFQEHFRSWILIGRPKEYDDVEGVHELKLNVGGSVGHGGKYDLNIKEGHLDEGFGGRVYEVSIARPSELERPTTTAGEQALAKDEVDKQKKEQLCIVDADAIWTWLENRGVQTKTAIRDGLKINASRVGFALARLIETNRAEEHQATVPNGSDRSRKITGYRVCFGINHSDPDRHGQTRTLTRTQRPMP